MNDSQVSAEQGRKRPTTAKIIGFSFLAGVVVLVLLVPVRGILPIPPVCWAWAGYEVPCAVWVAPTAAGLAGFLTGFVLVAMRRSD